jgi:hypothetical protein
MKCNVNIEEALTEFLSEAREKRDYSNAHAAAMKKVVKSASDLIRNLEKVKEVNNAYGKEPE